MRYSRLLALSFLSVSLPFLTGCKEKIDVVEVSGVVKVNGKPLDMIHVEFWPMNGPRSWGVTDAEGKFTLTLDTEDPQPGAVPGSHKVMLKDKWPSKDDVQTETGEWIDNSKGKLPRIHSKYYDAVGSDMTVTVKSGEPNVLEINADPRQRS